MKLTLKRDKFSPLIRYLLPLAGVVAILLLDRITKAQAITSLRGRYGLSLIDGILGLEYVENTGMAFGLFAGAPLVLALLRICGMIVIFGFFLFYDFQNPLGFWSVAMIFAGGVGNIIDYFQYGYVVDMIRFLFFNFPVFNVADCFITTGALLLGIYLLFFHKFPEDSDKNGTEADS